MRTCSEAPAEVLATVAETGAERRSGRMTPSTPAPSAVRSSAPEVVGVLDAVEGEEEAVLRLSCRVRLPAAEEVFDAEEGCVRGPVPPTPWWVSVRARRVSWSRDSSETRTPAARQSSARRSRRSSLRSRASMTESSRRAPTGPPPRPGAGRKELPSLTVYSEMALANDRRNRAGPYNVAAGAVIVRISAAGAGSFWRDASDDYCWYRREKSWPRPRLFRAVLASLPVCVARRSPSRRNRLEQSQRENAAIARGLKSQDPELLDHLIELYQHRLLRYLLFLTGKREVAEDLFQETWMRVLMRGSQYNGKARFDTWLFTIARNLVIDLSRKRTMASLDEMSELDRRWTRRSRLRPTALAAGCSSSCAKTAPRLPRCC